MSFVQSHTASEALLYTLIIELLLGPVLFPIIYVSATRDWTFWYLNLPIMLWYRDLWGGMQMFP